jgi:thiosulfate/3-mercaptopyruvate sulfurtransferase
VDARDPKFYHGAETRQARSGRIPGAVNVPFGSFFTDDGFFKPVATIDSIFTAAGVKKSDRVLSYCHIGQQATAVWFAARLVGHQAQLYDGSFDEWSRRQDLPVDSGKQP